MKAEEIGIHYDICHSTNRINLIRDVNEMMSKGWELVGGVAVVRVNASANHYYQALVKKRTLQEYLDFSASIEKCVMGNI